MHWIVITLLSTICTGLAITLAKARRENRKLDEEVEKYAEVFEGEIVASLNKRIQELESDSGSQSTIDISSINASVRSRIEEEEA